MLNFLKSLFMPPPPPSGKTAKERLKLVLLSDHLSLAPDVVESLKRDLLEVISRYVEIDFDHADVTFEQREREVAMLASIPITGIRDRDSRPELLPPGAAAGPVSGPDSGEPAPPLEPLEAAPGAAIITGAELEIAAPVAEHAEAAGEPAVAAPQAERTEANGAPVVGEDAALKDPDTGEEPPLAPLASEHPDANGQAAGAPPALASPAVTPPSAVAADPTSPQAPLVAQQQLSEPVTARPPGRRRRRKKPRAPGQAPPGSPVTPGLGAQTIGRPAQA